MPETATCEYCSQDTTGMEACTACMSRCDHCAEWTYRGDTIGAPDGDHYCDSCWGEYCSFCERCSENIWREHAVSTDTETLCCDCHGRTVYTVMPATSFIHNRSRRRCGIELEFIQSDRREPDIEDFGRLKEDGSVEATSSDDNGAEFASHIYRGDALLTMIDSVCSRLARVDAYVNKTCGFHVHIDVSDLTREQKDNLYKWWQVYEPLFYAMTAPSRRKNTYCRSTYGVPSSYHASHRYHAFNMDSESKHGTFEIRLHHGTIEAFKIKAWCQLLLAFFNTLSHIDTTYERLDAVTKMSDRGRLIFLMQQISLPLSIRKWIVKRIRLHNHHTYIPGINRLLDLRKAA